MATDERATLAAEAFVYGFPLVFDLQEVDRFSRAGMGGVPATSTEASNFLRSQSAGSDRRDLRPIIAAGPGPARS